MQNFPPRFFCGLEDYKMYTLNHFPDRNHTFRIQLNETGKFFQLIDNSGGIIAESNSWRELKKWAELKKLEVNFCQ